MRVVQCHGKAFSQSVHPVNAFFYLGVSSMTLNEKAPRNSKTVNAHRPDAPDRRVGVVLVCVCWMTWVVSGGHVLEGDAYGSALSNLEPLRSCRNG